MNELKAVKETISLGCVMSGYDYMNVSITGEENIVILMHADYGDTVERVERALTAEQTAAFTDKVMQYLLAIYNDTGIKGFLIERVIYDETNDIDMLMGHNEEEHEVYIELNGESVTIVLEQLEKIMSLIQKHSK
ncbi:gp193 [Bacillus phage W.Ph.]|uniref:Gp193 n=1 Tax=Bacillus phage W.Ph. TaxID=764595 RepID=G9B1U4_9CAUD|nr:gp193 [Bacillus phage W.Ph.]ADH03339.1 gp193 [Bacillus phage W.Ph.]